jgi:hypothetical protein
MGGVEVVVHWGDEGRAMGLGRTDWKTHELESMKLSVSVLLSFPGF